MEGLLLPPDGLEPQFETLGTLIAPAAATGPPPDPPRPPSARSSRPNVVR
jgi:hypothetical protein